MLKNKFIFFVPYCDIYSNFIKECINSIENQNYDNYEVIIVNDGSKTFIEKHKTIMKDNFIIINSDNNYGPAYSKWKFIEYLINNIDNYNYNDIAIILDGDDFLLPNALDIINDNYNTTPEELLSINYRMDYLGFFGYQQSTDLFFEEPGNLDYGL